LFSPGNAVLALLGCDRLVGGWFDLCHPAFRDTAMAAPSANVMGYIPVGVAGCRGLRPFSTASEGNPFNAIQQLTYCFVIFILSPLQIMTGIMMSPALGARFPWFPRILGGRQAARSLHFIGLTVFIGFIVVHISLVIAHGFGREMAKIVFGDEASSYALAAIIGLLAIAAVTVFHVCATWSSLSAPSQAKRLLEIGIDPLKRFLFHHWDSRQNYSHVSAMHVSTAVRRATKSIVNLPRLSSQIGGWM
jgi:hypothetical protein